MEFLPVDKQVLQLSIHTAASLELCFLPAEYSPQIGLFTFLLLCRCHLPANAALANVHLGPYT
jgi:hypothetical protein